MCWRNLTKKLKILQVHKEVNVFKFMISFALWDFDRINLLVTMSSGYITLSQSKADSVELMMMIFCISQPNQRAVFFMIP
jgi:hypothetical protein